MEEITKLQEEFMRLQKQESSCKISERVCMEILLKLIQREKIQLFYTSDRKEYLTPKQLSREIYDEILAAGGRLEIPELFPLLNIDESVIDHAARELVQKERSLSMIGHTIVGDYYIDKIAEEINESLLERGQLQLSELAQRFSLPLESITTLIRVRLISSPPSRYHRFIDGYLEPPLLYTKAFIARHTAKLRGTLSAITIPTPLQKIVQHFSFDESLFYTVFNELTQSARIPGSLQGRGETTEFVPTIYMEHRSLAIKQFFMQNGYIEYDTLQNQYQITQPMKYLKTNFTEGVALESCFLSNNEISLLEASIEEIIEQGDWLNARPLLPSPLTEVDVHGVLRECKIFKESKKPQAMLMCEIYVVSNEFLNKLLADYEKQFKLWAEGDDASRKELLASVDDLRSSTGSNISTDDTEAEEEEDLRKSGKGKKNKRRKAKKKKSQSSGNTANVKNLAESYIEQNKKFLCEWQPEMPLCLVDAIVNQLNTRLVDLREAAARAIFMDSSEKKKLDANDWQLEMQQLFYNITQFHHAASDFTGDSVPLEKHLLRTMCSDLAHSLIEIVAAQNFIKIDHSPIETVKQRNLALKKLAKCSPVHGYCVSMCSMLSKSCEEFLETLDPVFDALGVRMKPLDKKSEKKLVVAHKEALVAQFDNEKNPANAFHLGVVLLYVAKTGQMLHVPGKMIVDVLQELNSQVKNSEDFIEMIRFGDKVKEYLTAKIKKQDNHEDLLAALSELLNNFKRVIHSEIATEKSN